MNLSTWLMIALGASLCLALGGGAHAWWAQRKAAHKTRMPARWPLTARGLVTTEEYTVWKWLRESFHDHLVMVKLPVLRFTIPATKDKSEQWHQLLHGVYCTFTVCTDDGKVLGCIDVPGKRGLSQAQRDMKEAIFSDCGIAYTAVSSAKLPSTSAVRLAFLGEIEGSREKESEKPQAPAGDSSFHAELNAFTRERVLASKDAALQEIKNSEEISRPRDQRSAAGFNPDGTPAKGAGKSDRFAAKWDDSFIMPADTRPAKLD